jgi:hypothetical protein
MPSERSLVTVILMHPSCQTEKSALKADVRLPNHLANEGWSTKVGAPALGILHAARTESDYAKRRKRQTRRIRTVSCGIP